MKPNMFLSLISIAIACLVGYLAFNITEEKYYNILCGIFSTICFSATLLPAMGLHYKSNRLGVNIRILSIIFFVVFLISHFCFANFGIMMPLYVILNGIILLVYLAILYKMQNIKYI
jgi:hypothetical protein